jgi:penicillin-binding protein 1A
MSGTSSRLMGFVGRHASDTDFGGKTGTSNNHSDAWFVGVSPKLVVGAWVGGEYRSIHFRTGQLGQGNRTALPICGYFLQSVLDDPAFKRYHGKFAAPKDASLTPDMYSCGGYFQAPADSDSIATDSIALDIKDVENILLDDFGNPLQRPNKTPEPDELKNVPAPQQNEEATEDKKHI